MESDFKCGFAADAAEKVFAICQWLNCAKRQAKR
jgi:hypothetical protein